MSDIVAHFESIADGTDDGEINEPAQSPCKPDAGAGRVVVDTDGTSKSGMTKSRDAYNIYDFAQLIDGDQSAERNLNCVDDADD